MIAIRDKFGETAFEHITGKFPKLQQVSTLNEYQPQFSNIPTDAAVVTPINVNELIPVAAIYASRSSEGKHSIARAVVPYIAKELVVDIVCEQGNGSLAVNNKEGTVPIHVLAVATESHRA